jgi:hypothetical protein
MEEKLGGYSVCLSWKNNKVVTACVSHGRKRNFTKALIKKPLGTREILGSRRVGE